MDIGALDLLAIADTVNGQSSGAVRRNSTGKHMALLEPAIEGMAFVAIVVLAVQCAFNLFN